MNTETLNLRIQNIKAAIERETEGLTADELKVVHAAVATVPLLLTCGACSFACRDEKWMEDHRLREHPVALPAPSSSAEAALNKLLDYIEASRPSSYAPWRDFEKREMIAIVTTELAATSTETDVVREIYSALNVRWRNVISGDEFENDMFNRALSQILSTFQNICTSHKIDCTKTP